MNEQENSPIKILGGILIIVACLGVIGFSIAKIPAKSMNFSLISQSTESETQTEAQIND